MYFNVIVDISEKRGGGQVDMGALQDFQETIMRNVLIDAGFIDDVFTWCNNCRGHGRIWERLDSALFNLQFQLDFSDFLVQHLIRISSHTLLS